MPKAVFFESDGVLVETALEDLAAFNTAFQAANLKTRWDRELFARIAATPGTKARLRAYFDRYGWPLTQAGDDALVEKLTDIHKASMLSAARGGRLALRPGIKAMIDGAHGAEATLAIVTEMDGDVVTNCLAQLGLSAATKLKFMVCDGTSEKGKPAPDPYLAALQIAELGAEDAIAVEASPAGIRAAKEAGVFVIGAGNNLFPAQRLSGADKVISDLHSEDGVAALAEAILA
ncbi:MAG: HAD-IA family hydrolase [Pseudomonadota bacterium]